MSHFRQAAFAARMVQSALINPWRVVSGLRMEYRRRIGIRWDRKNRPGYSAPPTNITVVPTYRCNLDCIMCRQSRLAEDENGYRPWYDPKNEMPVSAWADLFDQVTRFRPLIYITGGEPMLYSSFRELVQEGKKRKLIVQIQTNGSLLARHADFLTAQGVEAITISLDGPPAVHDSIRRGRGSYDQLIEGARAVIAARKKRRLPTPVLSFNFTITRENFRHLPEVVDIAAGLGADFLQVQQTMFNTAENVRLHNAIFTDEFIRERHFNVFRPSIGQTSWYSGEMGPEDTAALVEVMGRAQKAARGRINYHNMPHISRRFISPYYLDLDFAFDRGCDNFWKTFRVGPDGSVLPCLNFITGNILEQSLDEIWNGDMMRQLRLMFTDNLMPGCVRCCQRHFNKPSRAF